MAKNRVRQRANKRKSFRGNTPAAYTTNLNALLRKQPTYRSIGNVGVRITNSELLTCPWVSSGATQYAVASCNPVQHKGTYARRIGWNYGSYRIHSITYTYQPAVGTAHDGLVCGGAVPFEAPLPTTTGLSACNGGALSQVHRPVDFKIDVRSWFDSSRYVHGPADEENTPFLFYVSASGLNDSVGDPGVVVVTYDITFTNPTSEENQVGMRPIETDQLTFATYGGNVCVERDGGKGIGQRVIKALEEVSGTAKAETTDASGETTVPIKAPRGTIFETIKTVIDGVERSVLTTAAGSVMKSIGKATMAATSWQASNYQNMM